MIYNKRIAEIWDSFINWDRRKASEGRWLCRILNDLSVLSILDVAAGTGFHAITLTKNGFSVEAWDESPAMLKIATRNACRTGIKIRLKKQAWLSADGPTPNKVFDSIICLGNSFAHLLSRSQRRRVLEQWNSLLPKNGILILDVRNFAGLVHSKCTQQPYCYYGNCTVDVALISGKQIDLSYRFEDGFLFSLSYCHLTPSHIAKEAAASGFMLVAIYGNGKRRIIPERVSFYQMVFRKTS